MPNQEAVERPRRRRPRASCRRSTTPHRPGNRRARYARVAAAGRARRSCDAGFEAGLELLAIEIAADENQPAAARCGGAPGPLELTIKHHVHAVKHVAPVLAH